MKDYITLLKEVGIAILLIIILSAVDVFAFRDVLPYSMEVPDAQKYTNLERENYKVVGDIQDAENPTETYAAGSSELELYQTELRYIPGSINPFVSNGGESNLPSERVGSTVSRSSDDNSEDATTLEQENIESGDTATSSGDNT